MDVHAFLKTRPCLEELDGYLDAIRHQIANPDLYHTLQYDELSGDVIGPIEEYRRRLMSGKETPAPSRLERDWTYKPKAKPTRRRPHEAGGPASVPDMRPGERGADVEAKGPEGVGPKVFREDRGKPRQPRVLRL